MATTHDISGYRIFSNGSIGSAHAAAHDLLDRGLPQQGHRQLGGWLRHHEGEGSEWVHLQWHMLVFELAVGEWDDAFARYLDHVLPAAGSHAPTDAPAGLWRLALSAPRPVELPWAPVREAALGRLQQARDPYVQLHDLLALAGAQDTDTLDRWLSEHTVGSHVDRVLRGLGVALRSYAAGDYAVAARAFAAALPELPAVGGSRAQNELFFDIYSAASQRTAA